MRINEKPVDKIIEWVNEQTYKSIPGVVQRKKDDEGEWIEDVFSSHQAVTRVRRKAENIIFNVSNGIFPSQKSD